MDTSRDEETSVEAASSSDVEIQLLPATTGGSLGAQACRPALLAGLAAAALLGLVALATSQLGSATAADLSAIVDLHSCNDKHVMSKEHAEKLDAAAKELEEFPDFLPMTPVIFPEETELHDAEIAVKLKELKHRHTIILLPNGTKVPFWRTLQYANRHFRIYISRFVEGRNFDDIPFKSRARAWAISSLFRKMLCHPGFHHWTRTNKFKGRGLTGKKVYKSFEQGHEGQFVQACNIHNAPLVKALATCSGIIFDNKTRPLGTTFLSKLLPEYAHETAHNLGYAHKTGVVYPLQYWAQDHGLGLTGYKVYDLAATPDFEVELSD